MLTIRCGMACHPHFCLCKKSLHLTWVGNPFHGLKEKCGLPSSRTELPACKVPSGSVFSPEVGKNQQGCHVCIQTVLSRPKNKQQDWKIRKGVWVSQFMAWVSSVVLPVTISLPVSFVSRHGVSDTCIPGVSWVLLSTIQLRQFPCPCSLTPWMYLKH